MLVPESKALKLDKTIKGRVFHAANLGNIHQPYNCFLIEDFAIRGKHWAQVKRQHFLISMAYSLIGSRHISAGFSFQARGLEQNGSAAFGDDGIDLLPVQSNKIPT